MSPDCDVISTVHVYGVDTRIVWVSTGYSQLYPWLPGEEDVRGAE